jgi:hypothetical protein
MLVARRLNHGYIQTLERSLRHRAVELDLSDVEDLTTAPSCFGRCAEGRAQAREEVSARRPGPRRTTSPAPPDPEIEGAVVLRSRDQDRIQALLRREEPLPASFVSYVIPLLAWDAVSRDATHALQKVAEERVGELIDALIDPNQPFAVRRRLARVFSVCVSQRAADGLILGLDDQRSRFASSAAGRWHRFSKGMQESGSTPSASMMWCYGRLLSAEPFGRSHGLLDRLEAPEGRSFVDEFVKDRNKSGAGARIYAVVPGPSE